MPCAWRNHSGTGAERKRWQRERVVVRPLHMPPPDASALIESLRSADGRICAQALVTLESLEHPLGDALLEAIAPLLGAPDKQLSRRAAGLLSRALLEGDARAGDLLRASLYGETLLERWGAAFALAAADIVDADVGAAALEALAVDDDGDIRWAAAGVVRKVAEREPVFLRRLESAAAEATGSQRKMCIYCLRDLGYRDTALYCAALGADDVGTRHAALSALQACGRAGDATISAVVNRLAVEDDPGVRRSLAIVLGRIMGENPDAAEALRRASADSDDADFKRAVALVLRRP